MDKSLYTTQKDLARLQANNWIDLKTRAVFLEFTLYNPGTNLFSYCVILFEFLPCGVILPSSIISPIRLLSAENRQMSDIVMAVYLVIVIAMMCIDIKSMFRLKSRYFKQMWNYVDWLIYGFSLAAYAIT
jgi:hypothetical protein